MTSRRQSPVTRPSPIGSRFASRRKHGILSRSASTVLSGLLAGLLFGAACEGPGQTSAGATSRDDRPRDRSTPAENPTASPTGRSEASRGEREPAPEPDLVYVKGRALRRFGIATGRDRKIMTLPSPDASAPPDASPIAYVASPGGETDEDFAARPVLHLLDPASGKDVRLGPGVSPLFSPGENRLAYLRPAGRRVCEGEECAGEVQVVTVDLASMEREILLPAGRWALLAWSDTRLFVSDERDLSRVVSVGLDGDRVALDVAPSEFWGVSPDGSRLLQSRPGRVRFLEIADAGSGELEGGEAIQLGGVLAEGLWRRAPTEVLGVLLERRATRSTLVRLRPGWRAPQAVEGSAGAVGGVLDAPDGRGFAFVRVAPSDPNRLQATYCSRAGDCRPLFEWVRGVHLLGLDGK